MKISQNCCFHWIIFNIIFVQLMIKINLHRYWKIKERSYEFYEHISQQVRFQKPKNIQRINLVNPPIVILYRFGFSNVMGFGYGFKLYTGCGLVITDWIFFLTYGFNRFRKNRFQSVYEICRISYSDNIVFILYFCYFTI